MDEVHEFVSETLYTAKCVRCEERSYFKLDGQYLTKKPAREKAGADQSRARHRGRHLLPACTRPPRRPGRGCGMVGFKAALRPNSWNSTMA